MAINQFDYARQRSQQRNKAQVQEAQDAIKRRFAAMGGLNSGAYFKQNEKLEEQGARQLGDEMQGIEAAENQEKLRQQEIKEQRDFARAEREASQAFARAERESGQGFASEQAKLQREFAKTEREAGQGWQEKFQGQQNDFQRGLFDTEMSFKQLLEANRQSDFAKQMELATQQFELDKKVTEFNMRLAKYSKEGQIAGLREGFSKLYSPGGFGDIITGGGSSIAGWF